MLKALKKFIFRFIPPSRRFMDRKMRECEESVYNMLANESNCISTLIENVTDAIKNNETIMFDSIESSNQQHMAVINKLNETLDEINKYHQQYENIIKQLSEISKEMNRNHAELLGKIQLQSDEVEKIKHVQNDIFIKEVELINGVKDDLTQNISKLEIKIVEEEKQLANRYSNCNDKLTLLGRVGEENIWANVFHDVIKDSVWLQNKAFAPGRWAAGYQMLYVMYRIMDSVKPKKILELGLGQTTRMISQYSGYYNAEHQVVEHDPKWIEFFATTYEVPDNVKFVNLDTVVDKYLDDEAVIMYQGFEEQFKNQKFDFICVDAPLGGKAIKYARVDILKILPECLEKDFVILIDDTERIGEINTIKLIQNLFNENGIEYVMKRYDGRKSSTIFTTEKYSFLTSL